MSDLKLRFELIKDLKKAPRLIVSVCCPDGCIDESVDCSEVVNSILKCVKEEETEKRN